MKSLKEHWKKAVQAEMEERMRKLREFMENSPADMEAVPTVDFMRRFPYELWDDMKITRKLNEFLEKGFGEENFSDHLGAAFLQPLDEVTRCLACCRHVVEDDDPGSPDLGVVNEPPVLVVADLVVLGEVLLLHLAPVVDPLVPVRDVAVLADQVGEETISLGRVLPCRSGNRDEHHRFLVKFEVSVDGLGHDFSREDGCRAVSVLEVQDELADHHLFRRQFHHPLQLVGVVVQDAYFLDVLVFVDLFHGSMSDMQR